jgi:hypothetical protein
MKKRFQETGIEIARPSATTVVLQSLPMAVPDKSIGVVRAGWGAELGGKTSAA